MWGFCDETCLGVRLWREFSRFVRSRGRRSPRARGHHHFPEVTHVEHDDIEDIVNIASRIALEGIVSLSYTRDERERLEHAARTGEWRPLPPSAE
jgi:hypothetical protein